MLQVSLQVMPTNHCQYLKQNAVCPLVVDNVIDIESDGMHMNSMEGCQYLCFQDKGCRNFTYFSNDIGKRCILFRGCQSVMPCRKCVSGPRAPPIMKCTKFMQQQSQNLIVGPEPGDPEITTFRPPFVPQLPRSPKQFEGQT